MPANPQRPAELSMRLLLRHPWVWLGLGWLFVVLATIASLVPGQKLPETHMGDKWQHSIGYALLTLWFTGMYSKGSYWKVGGAMFAFGVAIEIAQGLMPFGRQMDIRDVGANTIGIALGLAIALIGIGGWAQKLEALVRRW
jgi:VanZ family protein